MTNSPYRKRNPIPTGRRTWLLMGIDTLILLVVQVSMLTAYPGDNRVIPWPGVAVNFMMCASCVLLCRMLLLVYRQVWRYANTVAYIRLCAADLLACIVYVPLARYALPQAWQITVLHGVTIVVFSLLLTLGLRFLYHDLRERASRGSLPAWMSRAVNFLYGGSDIREDERDTRIKIAIVGAGRVGAMLAEELNTNAKSAYRACCFIEVDREKIGRDIMGLPILAEDSVTSDVLHVLGIQEIVFALPQMDAETKKCLYHRYLASGLKVKSYDYPIAQMPERGRRTLREFDIEELLFRKQVEFVDEKTRAFFRGKTVLVSGGGGSIGSELCRQIARMQPRQLIVLDVYENNAYDIQQELRIAYGAALDLRVEIASVRDAQQVDKVFSEYRPQIVLHAAAHKHVPLMEHNCSEAVKNNVFGTLNMVNAAEKYGAQKFIMISTDKAVNPTNVMGASKRMCEMIVQSRGADSKTVFSATRFGNVLGSNGSVIPLFKRQILNGGPITLTDKRIIRYFMTIPEASQLVLQSGAMAGSGELYVLDMGKPVKILELAENMIRLSGYEPYKDIDIVETGLRPGEKLYEELLIKTEELDRTENSMIFIERDKPLSRDAIEEKLQTLREALDTEDDEIIRRAMKQVVPTYHSPEAVNDRAIASGNLRQTAEESTRAVAG